MEKIDYEKILHSLPSTGVFIIREDNHEILYFNERVREVSPHVHIGMPCHELGSHSCANCPLLTIKDKRENLTLSYNSPFGEMVDIAAVRTMWEQEIPAFIVMVSPHSQYITNSYHKILRVNITQDHYEIIRTRSEDRSIGYGTDTFSSWLGQFIYSGGIHPDDMNNFISFTHPDHIKKALHEGNQILTCCYRRRSEDIFRWNMMEIVPDFVSSGKDQYIFIYIKDVHDILEEGLKLDDTALRIQEVIRMLGEQNFGIYGIDLNTGETNLVRENGHTHTGWESWTVQWNEILNSRLLRQIHPADQEKLCQIFSLEGLCQAKDTGAQKTDMLCQWRGEEDREYRYMAVIAYFAQNPGAQNYVILALQNVDKRVRQENTLTLRDMQLAAILKSRYSVMTTVYLENGQCERIWINEGGRSQDVLSGNYPQYFHRALETIVHPDDAEAFQKIMSPEHLYQMAAATEDYFEEICQYRMAGDSLCWLEQHIIYSRQGKRISVNILGRDITREKLAEESRRKEEQEQADIIRTLGSMFFATYYADLEKSTFRSVTQLEDVGVLLRQQQNYSTAIRAYAENFIHPDDREDYLTALSIPNLRNTLSKKQPYVTMAYRKLQKDSAGAPEDYGWIRSTAIMSQADAQGKAKTIVYAAQDITESKRKEMREQQALEAACEAADQANASRREFISSMSHNIRTPINGIIGMLQIASEHIEEPERIKDCLEKATGSSRQLLTMLNEILDISQIKAGGINLKSEPIFLPDLIDATVELIRPSLEKKELHLKLCPLHMEHKEIFGDQMRLQQMFLNILGNSIKYTPTGGNIEMKIAEHECGQHGCSSYDFIFSDSGIGMDEELTRHIFEPFQSGDISDNDSVKGLGLGLSIARNIARMMGGTISVKSTPKQGSVFTVTVILRLQYPNEDPELPDTSQRDIVDTSFHGYRILLVEDNELNQEIAMELIGEIGALVECASNGREALRRFAEMPEGYYDLILMDIRMPIMNGFEATRAIRKLPRTDAGTIPILALSANISPEDIAAGRDCGMNEHIAKPLNIPQLIERMDYWIKK